MYTHLAVAALVSLCERRPLLSAALVAVAATLSACAPPPSALAPGASDPSDPAAPAAAAAYHSPFNNYRSLRPVQPAPWREQNERAAPKPAP